MVKINFIYEVFLLNTGKNVKNPIQFLLGFRLDISCFSRKNQVWRKCNFPKFGLSRNIQWGLRQIPSLAHLYSQDWTKKEIAISRRGLIKNTTLDSKLSRTGYYFHFPGLVNKKSIQGLILSPYLENDMSILGFLRSPLSENGITSIKFVRSPGWENKITCLGYTRSPCLENVITNHWNIMRSPCLENEITTSQGFMGYPWIINGIPSQGLRHLPVWNILFQVWD